MTQRTDTAADLDACRRAHARLLETIDRLTDAQARGSSRLPGWTVGHVLTHLARHADSVVRRLDAAARDEIVDQYVGGPAGRAAAIDAGAGRAAGELVEDVSRSAAALEAAVASHPADAWERTTRGVAGDLQPAWQTVHNRIREVEIHHVDLGLGYAAADWPEDLVEELLASELPRLAGRADRRQLLAWVLGRGEAPALGPW